MSATTIEQLDFSEFFTTKPGASDFAERLSVVSEAIYTSNFNLEHVLMEQFGLQKKDLFMTLLRTNNIAIDAPAALKEFFDKLRERIIILPMVTITLAFEPREETLQKLSQWFLLQQNMQMLFDIRVNPMLIGGAEIDFKGKHVDFSIRPVFQEIIKSTLGQQDPTKKQPTTQPSNPQVPVQQAMPKPEQQANPIHR